MEELNTPAYKIASFELTDHALLEKVAKTGKPVIMSTGLASEKDIEEAINVIKVYHDRLVVLHCISSYPAPVSESNLSTISLIKEKFGVISGLS